MPRQRRRLIWTATGVALCAMITGTLGGCATGTGGTAATAEAIAEYATAAGIAPDLVFTTEADGYDLAPQSVGPGASEGMSATWFNQATGAMLTIRTESGTMTEASCVDTPLWDAAGETVTCTDEGGVWHREAGAAHEYIAVRGDAWIRVTGDGGAPREDMSAAAKAVHVPTDAELELLFSDLDDRPSGPVERGDIPENGDGAPIDPIGPGG